MTTGRDPPRPRGRLRGLALLVAAAGATAWAGCDQAAWILTKTIGPFVPEDEIPAQYSLKGKSLVVLVDTKDPIMASEYPRIEIALAEALRKELAANKVCGPVVPTHGVEAARRADATFNEWPVAEVGKYFNVDLVLHLELFEFRLKDNPSSNIYRGYAEAGIRLVSPQSGEQVWPVLSAARILSAETMPDVQLEQASEQEKVLVEGFADKIARQFYTYKKNDLPLRPKVK